MWAFKVKQCQRNAVLMVGHLELWLPQRRPASIALHSSPVCGPWQV